MSTALACTRAAAALLLAAVTLWPQLVTPPAAHASVAGARHRRQLQNSYLGLGSGVEILPVGDTSGVSSSYSVVETSKLPQRREYSAHRANARSNAARRRGDGDQDDAAADRSEFADTRALGYSGGSGGGKQSRGGGGSGGGGGGGGSGAGRVRFPEERRKPGGEDSDEDLDLDRGRPVGRKNKYKPKRPADDGDEETFGETKAAGRESTKPPPPRNIKEIVEERPAESKISSDLKDEGSRYIGSGGGYGGGAEFDKQKHFEKEQGEKFMEGHKSEEGEKAEKAFKKEEAFDKAEKEDYGADEKRSQVEEKAGEKKGHVDQSQHTGEAYQGNHGEKGISVVKKGGHKKGKKTSGFHKVHHKDEYKKDEVFYDESHDGGEHEEHQHEQEKHAKEKGASEKKGHTDTSYHESHGSKKGESDHGKKYQQSKGHNKEAGEQAHHGQNSEFSKKGGVKEGEKYGHSDAGGGGYFEKGGYF